MKTHYGMNALPEMYYEHIRSLALSIKSGMPRYEVEQLFPQSYGGVQGPCITIYLLARGATVEVPFDNFGGPCSGNNRVVGEPKVFIERVGLRPWFERQK